MPRRLDDYDAKRDFEATPEPSGEAASSDSGRLYVIQKHAASRLHYDLRLEHDGVLLSWAVPKGPSLDTKQRRLAVHVEDHPVDYGGFEGAIPEGEYGAGTVMVWDRGTWSPHGDVDESIAAGKLVFDLAGEKLQGRFGLIHTGARKTGRDQNQWLLIKERDDRVRAADEYDVTDALPDSAATGRTMDEIAADAARATDAGTGAQDGDADGTDADGGDEDDAEAESAVLDPASLPGAVPAPLPEAPSPQLASVSERVPGGTEWIHEIKHDGYRLMLVVGPRETRVLTRQGHDWTSRFPELARATRALEIDSAVIDCEAVVLGPGGVSDFGALQDALEASDSEAVVAFCFDLPHLGGHDLSAAPLVTRKRMLERVLATSSEGVLRFAGHVEGDRDAILDRACELGAEGIVSKRADAPYRAGRTHAWLKAKCHRRQEFVVVGRTAPAGSRTAFGALLLGYWDDEGSVRYAGRVGSGFSDRALGVLGRRLDALAVEDSPLADASGAAGAGVTWVRPQLVVEVRFTEWTADGLLRQAVYEGVRDDVDPGGVVRERDTGSRVLGASERTSSHDTPLSHEAVEMHAGRPFVAGVEITHPDREMVAAGPTKLDLARYYAAAAEHVLRHLGGRPLTLLRCPDGPGGSCFWQRHLDGGAFPHVESFEGLGNEYVSVSATEGLVELVQYLTVEFHTWGSTAEAPDRPNRLVFDLDPGPETTWDEVRAAALVVREILASRGLESFVKTSGGAGLHVVLPIVAHVPVKEAAAATKTLAEAVVKAGGGRLTIDPRKKARTGRIFVDWHRNGSGQSTVAPYVVRARAGGPISTPVTWEELRADLDPADFTADTVLARLTTVGDPWSGIDTLEQHLPQETLPGL